jgi:hypothetical protein
MRKKRAILLYKPVCIIAPTRMKTPRRKNTALVLKKEKTWDLSSIPRAGRRIIAVMLVAAMGMGVKIHRVIHITATSRHFIPSLHSPWGGAER